MRKKAKYLTFTSVKNAYVDFQNNTHTPMLFRKLMDLSGSEFVTYWRNSSLKSNFPFLKSSHLILYIQDSLSTVNRSPTHNKILTLVSRICFANTNNLPVSQHLNMNMFMLKVDSSNGKVQKGEILVCIELLQKHCH